MSYNDYINNGIEKFTFFWNGHFSQWHPCKFKDDITNISFNCAEQYMMYAKAIFFKDLHSAVKIIDSKSPREQKALGRKVHNFNEGKWNDICKDIVAYGNFLKFSQNPALLDKLIATQGTILVEASPYDKVWGIGLSETDPRARHIKTWQGKNWLGEILTNLRDDFIKVMDLRSEWKSSEEWD